jgi:hypothetical protein
VRPVAGGGERRAPERRDARPSPKKPPAAQPQGALGAALLEAMRKRT